jgi:hypothetical protein
MAKFRSQGSKIIVMGDWNRRIGNLPTVISGTNGRTVFQRKSQDNKVDRQKKREGRTLLETMSSWDMLTMNGIDSGGEFTYERIGGKGASVIDYIMLDKELVEYECEEDPEDGPDYKHKMLQFESKTEFRIGRNKLCYNPRSTKIWTDYPEVMSDHRLITCELRYPEGTEKKHEIREKKKRKIGTERDHNKKETTRQNTHRRNLLIFV